MQIRKFAIATIALLALSGCGTPGDVAAKVGGATISKADVELITRVSCQLNQRQLPAQGQGKPAAVPMKAVRDQVLGGLIRSVILGKLVRSEQARTYDRAVYRETVRQVESDLSDVSSKDRARYLALQTQYLLAYLKVDQLARTDLAVQGEAAPTDQQIADQVTHLEDDFRKSIKITVNPSYSPSQQGSLSRPVSSFAKQASASAPSAAWVAALPPNQRCG